MNIFNEEHIDFTEEPFFLGSGRNVARLDLPSEPWLTKQIERQLGKMWFKNDFSYIEDAKNYLELSEDTQWFYLENLNFQTKIDSLAVRIALEVFLPITTQPVGELWWTTHGFFEAIHEQTYAEIIKALPVNARLKFDEIMINPAITARTDNIIKLFNHTARMNSMRDLNTSDYSEDDHKKSIVMSLYAFNIIESYMFQTSFTCTFAFPENGYMESSGKSIGKIKQDEDVHVAVSQHLINRHKKLPDWAFAFEEQKEAIEQLYKDAYRADMDWIDHLFSKKIDLDGINVNVLKEQSEYNFYRTIRSVGVDVPCKKIINNPCSWTDKYSKLENNQNANNESDGAAYLLGVLDTHMSNEDWLDMPM